MKKTNNLSRLEFLKGAAAGAATFAVSGLLGSAALAEEAPVGGLYTPGTYTATAMGIGDVTVTMTFDETSITDVVVDVSKETKDIGQLYGETLQEALMQLQSADIDSVAGATVTSDAVKEAAANCIAQAMGVAIPEAETADVGEEMSWKEAPEPISDDQISQTIDTDVLRPWLCRLERMQISCVPGDTGHFD